MVDVDETEEYIDYLNHGISRYISHVIMRETNEKDSARISVYFKVSGDLERIADHAVNITRHWQDMNAANTGFSQNALDEIREMRNISLRAVEQVMELESVPSEKLVAIAAMEQQIDDMTRSYRANQLGRMQSGTCSGEACVIYSEILTDFERIGDHVLNIGREMSSLEK
ncbi:MAG: hypothetical protein IKM08_07665 [Clostridia bacterium]|nr:hypothetical protein [Clostridia bacterium]